MWKAYRKIILYFNWLNASLNFSGLFELQSPKRDNASSQVTEQAEESDKIQARRMLKKSNLSTCLCIDFVRRKLIWATLGTKRVRTWRVNCQFIEHPHTLTDPTDLYCGIILTRLKLNFQPCFIMVKDTQFERTLLLLYFPLKWPARISVLRKGMVTRKASYVYLCFL